MLKTFGLRRISEEENMARYYSIDTWYNDIEEEDDEFSVGCSDYDEYDAHKEDDLTR